MTQVAVLLGGLPTRTQEEISAVLRRFPDIRWVKLYGSRALGRQRPGSDIDLAFSAPIDGNTMAGIGWDHAQRASWPRPITPCSGSRLRESTIRKAPVRERLPPRDA